VESIEITKPAADSLANDQAGALRSWIGDRRVLVVAGLAIAGTGVALGWNWLAAVGTAPLIVSAAPCLAMCALGLCMMGRGQQACSSQSAQGTAEPPTRTDPSAVP
jgi:hypothetical protein